eukprot:2676862-Rhodomonas_salina.1
MGSSVIGNVHEGLTPASVQDDAAKWSRLTKYIDEKVLASAGIPLGARGVSCHIIAGDPEEDEKADNS